MFDCGIHPAHKGAAHAPSLPVFPNSCSEQFVPISFPLSFPLIPLIRPSVWFHSQPPSALQLLHAGMGSLPLLQDLSLTDINVILITHFHLDHCAALPWVVANMDFSGPIFMTHATKNIFYTMMKDILRMNQKDPARRLFNDRDLDNTMSRITVINFHQTIDYDGIKITPYRWANHN